MNLIRLSDLRDYWKQVSDWVTGKTESTPKVRSVGRHVGYSIDAKPQGEMGDVFIELDTKKVFLHDGNEWVEF